MFCLIILSLSFETVLGLEVSLALIDGYIDLKYVPRQRQCEKNKSLIGLIVMSQNVFIRNDKQFLCLTWVSQSEISREKKYDKCRK